MYSNKFVTGNTVKKSFPGPAGQYDKTYIAIVGGGPKGMYGLERLVAQLKAKPVSRSVEIHIYNRTEHFGSGDIYNPNQPGYLLMNVPVKSVNMWINEKPEPVVPQTLTLAEWLELSGEPAKGEAYIARAKVGRYLKAGFEEIISNLPHGVICKTIVGEVYDLSHKNGGYQIFLLTRNGRITTNSKIYNHILLATGHPIPNCPGRQRGHKQKSKPEDSVSFIYPVSSQLSWIPKKCRVGVKGMGLTFIDAALAFTEGRGGSFVRDSASASLSYIPSGREPSLIIAFSRSGLPMIPKMAASNGSNRLHYFTREKLQAVLEKKTIKQYDFEKDLWPLIKKDMYRVYYHTLYLRCGADPNKSNLSEFIDQFHRDHPEVQPFNPETFVFPRSGKYIKSSLLWNRYVQDYIRFYIGEAKKGLLSPFMAVTDIWRQANLAFRPIYKCGGLSPSSHRKFCQFYAGAFNRVFYGPPLINAEKMLALAEAGILVFPGGPGPRVKHKRLGLFELQSSIDSTITDFAYLIDARIPKISSNSDQSQLYHNLHKRGIVRTFVNQSGNSSFSPGCIEVNQSGSMIDKEGKVNDRLTATGTPTEGVTFDNDSLSRNVNNFTSDWAKGIRNKLAETT